MHIVFRASSGHLSRSLAYAEGMRETDPSSEITIITSGSPQFSLPGIRQIDIGTQNLPSWDLEYTENAIPEEADIILLDNCPDEKFQKAIKNKTRMVVVVDDEPKYQQYSADAIANPNIHAHTIDYQASKDTELLLGTEFCPLGSAFDEFQDFAKEPQERCRKISIHLGQDRKNLSIQAIRLLKQSRENFLATVSLAKDSEKGESVAKEIGLDERFIVTDQDPRRLSCADLAIASAETLHEFIFFRIPPVLADPAGSPLLSDYSSRAGISLPLDLGQANFKGLHSLMENHDERKRMSGRMTDIVDGLGRFRFAEELLRIYEDKF